MGPAVSSAAPDPMGQYDDIYAAALNHHLEVFGAFHPTPEDDAPDTCQTLLLLGPHEPGFWAAYTASPEYNDGGPDPLDRWSSRVVGALAMRQRATALFPFGGPPYRPFVRWAARCGRAWASPVTLLVHDVAGLMISYRGALALNEKITLPPLSAQPCVSCTDRPCASACPVSALTPEGYDLAACHSWLDTSGGAECMEKGCAARRACPVSKSYGRLDEQSAYHMSRFHK